MINIYKDIPKSDKEFSCQMGSDSIKGLYGSLLKERCRKRSQPRPLARSYQSQTECRIKQRIGHNWPHFLHSAR